MADSRSVIYFVRHGESVGNVTKENRSRGTDDPLSDTGKRQAQLLGQHLESVPFTGAYCSTYPRTKETAELVLSANKSSKTVDIREEFLIREKCFGKYESLSMTELMQDFLAFDRDHADFVPEGGGETRAEIESRIEMFLTKILREIDEAQASQTLLVVSHAGFLYHLWRYLMSQPNKFKLLQWKDEYAKVSTNTGYFKVSVAKQPLMDGNEVWELDFLVPHCTEHLTSLPGDSYRNFLKDHKTFAPLQGCMHQ